MKNKRNIYLMYGISLLQGMVFYGPIATLYRQAAGVSVFEITVIESISLALCIALEMPWGIVADRIGYKNTMVISCFIYVASKIVFWRADSFGGFLLERVMLSVVMAGMSGCDVSLLYLSCKEGESHRVFGIYSLLSTAGLLAAALIFSIWIRDDYRLAGFLTVCTYGISTVLAFGLKEVKDRKDDRAQKGRFYACLLEVWKDRRFLLLLVGMAFLGETNQTVTVFLNQLQYERCKIAPAAMGYLYILVTVSGMAGVWSAGITKKMGAKKSGLLLFLGACLSCTVLALTGNGIISVGSIVLLRLSASLFVPLQTELQNRHVKSADRATVLSIYAVLSEGTGVATNLLFGAAAQASLPGAMICGAVLCALGACFYAWWHHGKESGEKERLDVARD